MELDWFSAIYTYADADMDNCVNYDEMVHLFASGSDFVFSDLITAFDGDLNADGLLTWHEFNEWLATYDFDKSGELVTDEEKEAMKAFFKYFDVKYVDQPDYALSIEEAVAAANEMQPMMDKFYKEFNFFW